MYVSLHINNLLFLWNFNETSIFLTDIQKNNQTSNFKKIMPVGAKLFHVDGQTDMMQLIVVFHNFVNVPENSLLIISVLYCQFKLHNASTNQTLYNICRRFPSLFVQVRTKDWKLEQHT
jgi:hypothetical protein